MKVYLEDFKHIRESIKQLGIARSNYNDKYFVCNDRPEFNDSMVIFLNFIISFADVKFIEGALDIKLTQDSCANHYLIELEDGKILNDFYKAFNNELPSNGQWHYFTDHLMELEF